MDESKKQELENGFLNEEIAKFSGKPFKTGNKTATVKNIRDNPYTDKPAFEIEDGSVVDVHMCHKAEKIIGVTKNKREDERKKIQQNN